MKTSQKQISLFTEEQLTSLPVDSHANLTQAQVSDLGKRTSDTSGRICSESFQKLSQPTLWAKTFVDLLIGQGDWSSKKCALTWKLKGTKYNRYYCQLVPSVRHTEEIVSGLLPTPTVGEHKANKTYDKRYQAKSGLTAMAHNGMLPTPTVFDSTNASATMKSTQVKEGSMHSMTLTRMMDKGLLPTPTVSGEESYLSRAQRQGHEKAITHLQAYLEYQMLPTPNAFDWNTAQKQDKYQARKQMQMEKGVNLHYSLRQMTMDINPTGTTSQLNPRFVAEMMGFPPNWTELPFLNGEQNL